MRWPRENSEPSSQAPRSRDADLHVEYLGTIGMQSCWARPINVSADSRSARSTRSRRRLAGLASPLRHGNTRCMDFGGAWAHLRQNEGLLVNKKKIHRLWKEEGLQVQIHCRSKRVNSSSGPDVRKIL